VRIVLRSLTVVGGNLCPARLALLDQIRQHGVGRGTRGAPSAGAERDAR